MSTWQVVVEKSPADLKVDEISEYVTNLETNMDKASQAASLLVKRHIDLSIAQSEIGTAFTNLGGVETDSHGPVCTNFGTIVGIHSVTTNQFAEQMSVQFEEPLQDFCQLVRRVKQAMKRRENKRSDYVACVTDLEAKQASYQKYLSQPDKQDKAAQKLKVISLYVVMCDIQYNNISL